MSSPKARRRHVRPPVRSWSSHGDAAADVFKDAYTVEFLNLPADHTGAYGPVARLPDRTRRPSDLSRAGLLRRPRSAVGGGARRSLPLRDA